MSNLLSQRLRNAKKELTALKTAHKRGFGNLKVYTTSKTVQESGTSYLLNLVINFDVESVAYPFVQVYGSIRNDGESNLEVLGGGYTNNGYTYKLMALCFPEAGFDTIYVDSTLPVSSITYTWGR